MMAREIGQGRATDERNRAVDFLAKDRQRTSGAWFPPSSVSSRSISMAKCLPMNA
jgi:hypothetical protein